MVKKILKIIGIVLLIAIIILLIHTIRNFVIISNLQNKIAEYENSQNHHIKLISTQEDGTVLTTNYYKKDDKNVVFIERNRNGEIVKIAIYDNGETHNTYTETSTEKVASLNSGLITVQIFNGVETDTFWQKVLVSMVARIGTAKENGKKYYKLSHLVSTYALLADTHASLIDSETGLLYKSMDKYSTVVREYEFNNVDDSIFIEPDISEYEVRDNYSAQNN